MAAVHYFQQPFIERIAGKKRQRDEDDQNEDKPKDEQVEEDHCIETEVPADFPHAPLKRNDKQAVRKHASRKNVKAQHIAVLTTILHKCMLEGDYLRAGRAFSTLLRIEMRGSKPDLRQFGLWGIGAEILLRRGGDAARDDAEDIPSQSPVSPQRGFQAARAYYDRLILQYPFRKAHPTAVSELHFNLAMFGVWIFEVQNQSQSALTALESGVDASEVLTDLGVDTFGAGMSEELDAQPLIKSWELEQARSIESRIERLTLGPPFDKDAQLLRLGGMVALWISDLLKSLQKSQGEVVEARHKASSHLRRAKENGASIWKQAEDAAQISEDEHSG